VLWCTWQVVVCMAGCEVCVVKLWWLAANIKCVRCVCERESVCVHVCVCLFVFVFECVCVSGLFCQDVELFCGNGELFCQYVVCSKLQRSCR